ncbi:MAG: thioether cross-link-forming SCIFF peptide maturase [Peptococcaceae bacterium]|nr:MAG: thioether cross-link-forming SCIFF peptide maturase [Peptococcaceae bacterium]
MIHRFTFDGVKIVLDVHSGAVHVVDDLAWALIEDYPRLKSSELLTKYRERYQPREIAEALTEIEQLKEEGLLYSPDPYPEGYSRAGESVLKALCLHLAHRCNLGCRYCFAGQGRFGGEDELMVASVGRAAIDFLIAGSGRRQQLEVDFFGGEPLLNFPALKEVVEYGRRQGERAGKNLQFTLTTNALLLTEEVAGYLEQNGISVILSIDGRPAVHNAMRTNSYSAVLENIRRFLEFRRGYDYYLRGTFTRYNLDFGADVLHLADLGFDRLSIEPVVAPAEDDFALRPEDLPVILDEYERLTRQLVQRAHSGRPVEFYHFNIDLSGGPCLARRLSGCGAGHEYLAVAPDGTLYPCHQFVGRKDYRMGNITGGTFNREIMGEFRRAHLYNKEQCPQCWAKFYCSGGCHANAEAFNGTIFQPYEAGCVLARKRLECALYLKVQEAAPAV